MPAGFVAARFPYCHGDVVGDLTATGIEIDVIRDKELACPDGRCPRSLVELRGAVIGLPVRVLELSGEPFVFARPHRRQIVPVLCRRRIFVQVDGNPQLFADTLTQLIG